MKQADLILPKIVFKNPPALFFNKCCFSFQVVL